MDIAEAIETTDNQTFTVKLKKGYKFHDGTEVKAKNFVDAWNFTNYSPNAFTHNGFGYFFASIEGYDRMQSADPDEDGPKVAPAPEAKEFSGLKVIDDYTFEIKMSEKFAALRSTSVTPPSRRCPTRSSRTPRPSVTSRSARARTSSTRTQGSAATTLEVHRRTRASSRATSTSSR